MKYSDRKADIAIDRRVEDILNHIYKELGLNFSRTDKSLDLRGVDCLMKIPGSEQDICVDEKCATHYWNVDLKTYSVELLCNATKTGLGWFAPEENGFYYTTHYMFVWIRAKEKTLEHIESVELMLVDKKKLQKRFLAEVGVHNNKTTREIVQEVMTDYRGKEVDYFRVCPDITLRKCDICPEYPVNAIISKDLLDSMSVWHKKVTFQ